MGYHYFFQLSLNQEVCARKRELNLIGPVHSGLLRTVIRVLCSPSPDRARGVYTGVARVVFDDILGVWLSGVSPPTRLAHEGIMRSDERY